MLRRGRCPRAAADDARGTRPAGDAALTAGNLPLAALRTSAFALLRAARRDLRAVVALALGVLAFALARLGRGLGLIVRIVGDRRAHHHRGSELRLRAGD